MKHENLHSALMLAQRLRDDPELLSKAQQNPDALEALAHQVIAEKESPLTWDKWIYRIVVCSLGLTILLVVISAFVLALHQQAEETKIPEVLTAIGSAAVGALAGLLAPSPANKSV